MSKGHDRSEFACKRSRARGAQGLSMELPCGAISFLRRSLYPVYGSTSRRERQRLAGSACDGLAAGGTPARVQTTRPPPREVREEEEGGGRVAASVKARVHRTAKGPMSAIVTGGASSVVSGPCG